MSRSAHAVERRALEELVGGVRIRLEANLEIADEVGRVHDAGAEGIGLYRSEFLLTGRGTAPLGPMTGNGISGTNEDEQYQI